MFNIDENFAKVVWEVLKGYGAFRLIMGDWKKGLQSMKNGICNLARRKYYEIGEIFDEVQNENIIIGEFIETSGYLLEYSQTFKPRTRIGAGIYADVKYEGNSPNIFEAKGEWVDQGSFTYKLLQPPVQKIPPFNGIGCAFIYDERFEGFEHEQNKNEDSNVKPLVIKNFSKPIIVLYDTNQHQKFLGKKVLVKGQVVKVPPEFVKNLGNIYDDTITEICSNFFRPYNESVNFICISLLNEKSEIVEIDNINDISGLTAPLFVEAQLEGLNTLQMGNKLQFISELIPDLVSKRHPNYIMKVGFSSYGVIPFINFGDVKISFTEPETIGFFTASPIFDKEAFETNLRMFSTYVGNFSIDFKNTSNKHFGRKLKMPINFIYDYEKQYLFSRSGVLNSNTANYLYEHDEHTRVIQDWLKNSTKS